MRSQWINELVNAGYDAGVVATLNNNELAELVQEEFVTNTWSEAARAAARTKRAGRHGQIAEFLAKKKFKPAGNTTHTSTFRRNTKEGIHQIEVDKETGQWSHRKIVAGASARKGGGTGVKSLTAHIKAIGLK